MQNQPWPPQVQSSYGDVLGLSWEPFYRQSRKEQLGAIVTSYLLLLIYYIKHAIQEFKIPTLHGDHSNTLLNLYLLLIHLLSDSIFLLFNFLLFLDLSLDPTSILRSRLKSRLIYYLIPL